MDDDRLQHFLAWGAKYDYHVADSFERFQQYEKSVNKHTRQGLERTQGLEEET